MQLFERKDISFNRETVGSQLKQAREEKKITVEQIAKKLLIRASYLSALETGDRRKLPKGVYARNFLREYARFLGLDYKSLLDQYKAETVVPPKSSGGLFERQIVAKRYLVAMPALVRNTIIIVVAAFCLIYLGFLVKRIFEPPLLVIDQPSMDITVQEKQIEFKGHTSPETDVTINGQSAQVAVDGTFGQTIYLEPGLNTISVTAKKKYSRTAVLVRNVLYQENK